MLKEFLCNHQVFGSFVLGFSAVIGVMLVCMGIVVLSLWFEKFCDHVKYRTAFGAKISSIEINYRKIISIVFRILVFLVFCAIVYMAGNEILKDICGR